MAHLDSPTNNTASINSLPNEILENVLRFIPMDSSVEYRTSEVTRVTSQVIALMNVSRTFRLVTLSSEFWLEPDFDVSSLFPDPLKQIRHPDVERWSHLFRLPEVARILERKTNWFISRWPQVLFYARTCLPLFETTARRVVLKDLPLFFHTIRDLEHILSLTDLELRGNSVFNSVELGIFENFGQLKRLVLELPSHWTGRIPATLDSLEYFTLAPRESARVNFELSDRVLPFGSKNTLMYLSLTGWADDESFSIAPFNNLSMLVCKSIPLSNVLDKSTSTLRSFETEFILPSGPAAEREWGFQKSNFDCHCLRSLRQLCLKIVFFKGTVDDAAWYLDGCMRAVKIISECPFAMTLEELELWAGLDLDDVTFLSEFEKLRILRWNYPNWALRLAAPASRLGITPAAIVSKVFEIFPSPPKVCVQVVRRPEVRPALIIPSVGHS
jgi:hypothetical protein